MHQAYDEETLREQLHEMLDDLPFGAVEFESVARRARRRQRGVAVGAGASALAVASLLVGTGLLVGDGGPGVAPGTGPSPMPSTAERYCPPRDAGTIDWPAIDDQWVNASPAPSDNADGRRVPFTPEQVFICRYPAGGDGKLIGSARVTDPVTVAALRDAMNGPSRYADTNPCDIDSGAFVWFTKGTTMAMFNVDLTSCNVWLMPDSIIIDGSLADQLRGLTPG